MPQVQTISREVVPRETELTPQRLHADPSGCLRDEIARAYLLGALGDGTFNWLHRTIRFAQKERQWLELLRQLLGTLGSRSWIYREGKTRQLYVLETSAKSLNGNRDPDQWKAPETQAAYIRGYFDAEGGIPQNPDAPLYIQFVQKDFDSLAKIKSMLEQLSIACGVIHNPSKRVDPDYWRFFVRRESHQRFIHTVGSWQPRKAPLLQQRVKI